MNYERYKLKYIGVNIENPLVTKNSQKKIDSRDEYQNSGFWEYCWNSEETETFLQLKLDCKIQYW